VARPVAPAQPEQLMHLDCVASATLIFDKCMYMVVKLLAWSITTQFPS